MHLGKSRCIAVSVAAATLLIVSMSLADFFTGSTISACATRAGSSIGSSVLITAKGVSNTTLPPSHDNDVGDARIPDTTPDADVDANQKYFSCSRPK